MGGAFESGGVDVVVNGGSVVATLVGGSVVTTVVGGWVVTTVMGGSVVTTVVGGWVVTTTVCCSVVTIARDGEGMGVVTSGVEVEGTGVVCERKTNFTGTSYFIHFPLLLFLLLSHRVTSVGSGTVVAGSEDVAIGTI